MFQHPSNRVYHRLRSVVMNEVTGFLHDLPLTDFRELGQVLLHLKPGLRSPASFCHYDQRPLLKVGAIRASIDEALGKTRELRCDSS